MRRTILNAFAAITLSLAAITATATGASASSVMVTQAFARASATPTAKSGAAYVTLMNHAGEADKLISASSPAAKTTEIHTTEMVDGVMKMKPAGVLEIPAMGTLEMKPGSYHVMLMGLVKPLKEGEQIEVTLTFEKAGELKVTVPVGAVAAGGHGHGMEGSEAPAD